MTWQPTLVTTIDGRQVLCDSEEWRACTEAVYTLAKPHADRDAWLAKVERHRGAAGRHALEQEITRVEPAYLLAFESRDARRSYLELVEIHHGQLARERLEQRIVALWEQRKAAAAA